MSNPEVSMKEDFCIGLPEVEKLLNIDDGCTLIGVNGQVGSGKTRFVTGTFVYNALVNLHKNVMFYELEQFSDEVKAMLTSLHLFHTKGLEISDSDIYTNRLPDGTREQVRDAYNDLFKSGKYGVFSVKNSTENGLSIVDYFSKNEAWFGPSDLIVVDDMDYLCRVNNTMPYAQSLDLAYKSLKSYLESTGKQGIAIDQTGTTELIPHTSLDRNIRLSTRKNSELKDNQITLKIHGKDRIAYYSKVINYNMKLCHFYE